MAGVVATGGEVSAAEDQPNKYLSALIASVNEGAKATQSSTIAISLVGLYLAAASISIGDEDLFRGNSFQISQLGGVSIPIVASFILGPILFVFLHVQLLLRYWNLAEIVFALKSELEALSLVDQERCRQLVAKADFVGMILKWKSSRHVSSDHFIVLMTTAILPVAVLIVVQVSFVRYQNVWISIIQTTVFLIDLLAITGFHLWLLNRKEAHKQVSWHEKILNWLFLAALPLAVAVFCLVYTQVPAVGNSRIRFWDLPVEQQERALYLRLAEQPLDMVLCPSLEWGCRYLRLNNRKLVGGQTKEDALWKVVTESKAGALAAIDGLSLRGRTLRYANFNASRALKVDLVGDDLRHASFWNASFQGASMSSAKLQGANLDQAQLQEADLKYALLTGASLKGAQLQGADLEGADLRGADLSGAQLVGANLNKARLQGASLELANLRYVNLQQVEFNHTAIDAETHFDFADMRNINFHPTEEDSRTKQDVLEVGLSEEAAKAFLGRMAEKQSVIADKSVEHQVYLALSKTDKIFSQITDAKIIDENNKYFEDLKDQAENNLKNPIIAGGLVRRTLSFAPSVGQKEDDMVLASGGSATSQADALKQSARKQHTDKLFEDLVCALHHHLLESDQADFVAIDLMRQLDALSWKCPPTSKTSTASIKSEAN